MSMTYHFIVETDQTSSKDVKEQMALARNCGTLKVSLFYMRYSDFEKRLRDSYFDQGVQGRKIAEKALKGKAIDSFTA